MASNQKPTTISSIGNTKGNPTLPENGGYNTYVGARYVPVIYGEWNSKVSYEPLTIVSWKGNSYTSKTYVPAGIDIGNTTYWVKTADYNSQVEYYRQEVEQAKQDIDDSEARYKQDMQDQYNTFTSNTNNTINQYKTDIDNDQKEFEKEITDKQNNFESSINNTIEENVETQTQAWLDNHITESQGAVDDTLLLNNAGANSLTVGTRAAFNNFPFLPIYNILTTVVVGNALGSDGKISSGQNNRAASAEFVTTDMFFINVNSTWNVSFHYYSEADENSHLNETGWFTGPRLIEGGIVRMTIKKNDNSTIRNVKEVKEGLLASMDSYGSALNTGYLDYIKLLGSAVYADGSYNLSITPNAFFSVALKNSVAVYNTVISTGILSFRPGTSFTFTLKSSSFTGNKKELLDFMSFSANSTTASYGRNAMDKMLFSLTTAAALNTDGDFEKQDYNNNRAAVSAYIYNPTPCSAYMDKSFDYTLKMYNDDLSVSFSSEWLNSSYVQFPKGLIRIGIKKHNDSVFHADTVKSFVGESTENLKDFITKNLINGFGVNSVGVMSAQNNRACFTYDVNFDVGFYISVNRNWHIAVQYYDPNFNSGWKDSLYVLPNRKCRLMLKKDNNNYFTYESMIHAISCLRFDDEITPISNGVYDVVLHRTYSGLYPENTIEGIIYGYRLGYKYIECDVRFSNEGTPYLSHDDEIAGISISDSDDNTINAIDLSYALGTCKIPSLKNVLFVCKCLGVHLYAELVEGSTENQVKTVCDLIKEFNLIDNTTIISFDTGVLNNVAENLNIRRGFIGGWSDYGTKYNSIVNKDNIFFDCSVSTYEQIDFTTLAVPLELWTINDSLTVYNEAGKITSDNITPFYMMRRQLTFS